jgi:hypothetical protein
MNKIRVEVTGERVKVEFDFENIEVAKQSLKDEEFIDDVVGALARDEERHYDDNDMLRAEVTTQVGITSSKTLAKMLEVIQEELNKR